LEASTHNSVDLLTETPQVAAQAHIILTDPTLFGNDAAEDETDEIFYSYALTRNEVEIFADPERRLCIAHAYKGEGKSALLRLTDRAVQVKYPESIKIARRSSDLSPDVARDDYASWVRGWKVSIFNAFALEIGAKIGVAWSDDAMSLVEESEKAGFRSRSFVASVIDRLRMPELSVGAQKLTVPERRVLGTPNPGETVRRWLKKGPPLWRFVDDVDKNFENTRVDKMRTAAFFDASRDLTKPVPELRIRTVVRPNIWTILQLSFESLSHVRQYLVELTWSEEQRLIFFPGVSRPIWNVKISGNPLPPPSVEALLSASVPSWRQPSSR